MLEELTKGYIDIKHPENLIGSMSEKVFKQWLRTDEGGNDTGEYDEEVLQRMYLFLGDYDLEEYRDIILTLFVETDKN